MLNKRISRGVVTIVIVAVVTAVLAFTGYQGNKIKQLENDLYFKNRVEERKGDSTITNYDRSTIQTKFNALQEYKIFDSRISVKHSYEMEEEAMLGLHRKATLVGNANVYFQYQVSLANAYITETADKITIQLSEVYLDRDTVNIVPNSFIRLDDECSKNILANYKMGEKLMDYWNQSLIEKSHGYIEENFNDSVKIQSYAIKEVKDLVKTITDKNVEVIFKK
jgi:hypothetical protein